MTEKRSGALPLLISGGLLAVVAGVFVALQRPDPLLLRVGGEVPELGLADLSGQKLSLEALRGRVVFVNFWGTWCAPCRDEAPSLERLYRELGREDLEILAISVDDSDGVAEVEAFRKEFDLTFPILHDPAKRAYEAYGVTGVPETFMLGPDGRLIERFVGPRDWVQPRYAQAVRRVLEAHRGASQADG